MFGDRFSQSLRAAGVSASEFSRIVGCSRSYVSRLLKQEFAPTGDEALKKIALGVVDASSSNERTAQLARLCSAREKASYEELCVAAAAFLRGRGEDRSERQEKNRSFPLVAGKRIDAVMKLTQTSNMRLGKYLNVDPSYISRLRSGKRTLERNPVMMRELAVFLYGRAYAGQKIEALAEMMGLQTEDFSDRDAAFILFYDWIHNNDLNKRFDPGRAFDPAELNGTFDEPTTIDFEDICRDFEDDGREIYVGIDGLRRALLRFLICAAKEKVPSISLFSDQDSRWMTEDAQYSARLGALIRYCIGNGTEVRIIHNVHRSGDEMSVLFKIWLPLYLSGKIDSYYSRSLLPGYFRTTMFIMPGKACIFGSNVAGSVEEDCFYRYETQKEIVDARFRSFERLLDFSVRLVHTVRSKEFDIAGAYSDEGFSMLNVTLPLATMPEQTLRSILQRTDLSKESREEIERTRVIFRQKLLRSAKKTFVNDFAPIPRREDLEEGRIRVDIPGVRTYYEREEYFQHLASIGELSAHYPGYKFYFLRTAPAWDMKLLLMGNTVAMTHLGEPLFTVVADHPEILKGAALFFENLKKEAVTGVDPTAAVMEEGTDEGS